MTNYSILKLNEDKDAWAHHSVVAASSAKRALAANPVEAGEYLVVPSRNVKPFTVKVEQTTKVTIG